MAAAKVTRQAVLYLAANPGDTYTQTKNYIRTLASIDIAVDQNLTPRIKWGGMLEQDTCTIVAVRDPNQQTIVPLVVYPLPFTDQVSLEFSWPEMAPVDLRIYDATGRRMLQRRFHAATGANNLSIETQNWPSGTYFIFAESTHYKAREVAIKQR